jgi:hypothetical protein
MDELNTTRNLVQHHGQVPEEATVIKLVTVAKEFSMDFWLKEFAVSYEDVSLTSLIDDEGMRKLLNVANDWLNKHELDFITKPICIYAINALEIEVYLRCRLTSRRLLLQPVCLAADIGRVSALNVKNARIK